MAGITLAYAQQQLEYWLAEDAKLAQSGQSYGIGSRNKNRVDAAEVTRKIEYWNGWVQKLDARARGNSRIRYVVPK